MDRREHGQHDRGDEGDGPARDQEHVGALNQPHGMAQALVDLLAVAALLGVLVGHDALLVPEVLRVVGERDLACRGLEFLVLRVAAEEPGQVADPVHDLDPEHFIGEVQRAEMAFQRGAGRQ